jgi:O-antigen/teichoic acid export membrane protein
VLSDYLSGLGLTGTTSAVTILAFIINVAANLILIPRFGIVGASAASLVSYAASSIVITLIAARLAHAPARSFLIPRLADVRFVLTTVVALTHRVRGRDVPDQRAPDD